MIVKSLSYLYLNIFFLRMIIFRTMFWRCLTLWNSTLKMTMLFWRWLTLFISVLHWKQWFGIAQHCGFQHQHTQHFVNFCLKLSDFATLNQSKNNVETKLNALLGSNNKTLYLYPITKLFSQTLFVLNFPFHHGISMLMGSNEILIQQIL